jgi:hypothetical protein
MVLALYPSKWAQEMIAYMEFFFFFFPDNFFSSYSVGMRIN